LIVLLLVGCQEADPSRGWETYKADATSSSYCPLRQISTKNVDQLEMAWTYRTGDLDPERHPGRGIETNPIIVEDVLYGVSPHLKVFAIDAATGEERWVFDPFEDEASSGQLRAVVHWDDAAGGDRRILFTAGTWLYALDADTGTLVSDFGRKGRVSLNVGLRRDPDSISVHASSPGIVYQDLLIMGSAVGEGRDAAPGDIRAYDVRTGEIVWTFHTIPQPGEPGADTWNIPPEALRRQGGANNWAGMSLDRERGIVYVPTGSPVYDFYGGNRPGKNLYGSTLLALDAATGERIWHYQTVHHDLWDYDLPAPPNLVTLEREGEVVDAVAQITKQGFTFLFNRVTGEPLFPIEERPVPRSHIEGEAAWPTQPFPTKPEPLARQHLTPETVTDISPEARDSVLAALAGYRNEGLFTPPDPAGTVVLPGTRGAVNWGGAAHDPASGILYVNVSEVPQISTVQRVGSASSGPETLLAKGRAFYTEHCATCHGSNRKGRPPTYPALTDLEGRRSAQEVLHVVERGGGMMPAFPTITGEEKEALIAFLFDQQQSAESGPHASGDESVGQGGRYVDVTAYKLFRGPDGYPAIEPPWGKLTAVDLNTGEMEWTVPLGAHPELAEQGRPPTGMLSIGGPIVTAGGLIFIAGTEDRKLRAFDKDTGEQLWETTLPTGAFTTPATYMTRGRQYVVIAVGGGRGTPPGDYYIAFALPK
jgi:quinoprotein glucose dehydrogenase